MTRDWKIFLDFMKKFTMDHRWQKSHEYKVSYQKEKFINPLKKLLMFMMILSLLICRIFSITIKVERYGITTKKRGYPSIFKSAGIGPKSAGIGSPDLYRHFSKALGKAYALYQRF